MKYLKEFSEKRIFDFQYVLALTKNRSLAAQTIRNYQKKGYIVSIKKNLFGVISLETGGLIASKYEIASHISKSSFVSHHSALEFYGYAHQVYKEVQVSSLEQFHHFSFEQYSYHYLATTSTAYVEKNQFILVSSLSRSVVDVIDRIRTYDDLEELIQCLKMIPRLNEEEILDYLIIKDTKILYNKIGLILSFFQESLLLSDNFYLKIKRHMGKHRKYLAPAVKKQGIYYKEWYLYSYDMTKVLGDI